MKTMPCENPPELRLMDKPRPQSSLGASGLVTVELDCYGHFDLRDVECRNKRTQSGYREEHTDSVAWNIPYGHVNPQPDTSKRRVTTTLPLSINRNSGSNWWYIGSYDLPQEGGPMKYFLIPLMLLPVCSVLVRADCWPATCSLDRHSVCVEQCDPNYLNCTVKICKCHCEPNK